MYIYNYTKRVSNMEASKRNRNVRSKSKAIPLYFSWWSKKGRNDKWGRGKYSRKAIASTLL